MRIYYVTDSPIPSRKANGIQVMKMCQAFARQGGDVELLCYRLAPDGIDLFEFYGVSECFRIAGPGLPAFSRPTRIFNTALQLARLLLEREPGIVYSRDAYLLGALMLWPRLRMPCALEMHIPPLDAAQRALMARGFAHPCFRRLVLISRALEEEYHRIFGGLLRGKSMVAHDGADDLLAGTGAEAEADYRQRSRRFTLGYIGNLYSGRGIRTICGLADRLPDCAFEVVGGTDGDLARWDPENRKRDNLTFHGFVEPARIPAYLTACDVMLAPYHRTVMTGRRRKVDTSQWMSPLKVFEYMAAGKPIVASRLPVLGEVLSDGHNALLAEPEDLDAWVERIGQLRADAGLRERIGRQARADFLKEHTWDRRARDLLAAIAARP
jgi:glycosyltransferase involved in cell wall biosynthesis